MITVHHAPQSRSLRVLWALEEMGLAYETQPADVFKPGRDFLRANPSATVPTLVDGDGSVVIESGAILQYLAARHGPTPLEVRPEEPGFADYLQFLWLGEAGLAAPLSALIGGKFLLPEDQRRNATTGIIVQGFEKRLRLVDRQLKDGRDFLAAGRFTFADVSVGWTLGLCDFLELGERLSPVGRAYLERMRARPAFQRAAAR